jgi:hypothetical protein
VRVAAALRQRAFDCRLSSRRANSSRSDLHPGAPVPTPLMMMKAGMGSVELSVVSRQSSVFSRQSSVVCPLLN